MKIIPFDIKLRNQIQSEENRYKGRYEVQTKDGRSVKIVCWDVKDSNFPIVAIVDNLNKVPFSFCKNGKYNYSGSECDNDLYLIDTWEPKFKIGDIIRYKGDNIVLKVVRLNDKYYSAIKPLASISSISYDPKDLYYISYASQDLYELIPEEPKLTEFEKVLANCLYKSFEAFNMDEIGTLTKEYAPKLLELAKKEIIEKLREK